MIFACVASSNFSGAALPLPNNHIDNLCNKNDVRQSLIQFKYFVIIHCSPKIPKTNYDGINQIADHPDPNEEDVDKSADSIHLF